MAFEILNEAASVLYVLAGDNRYPQAEPDKVDFDILAQGIDGEGVVSGCAVTPQGIPDTTVAVAAGIVRIAGTDVAYAGGNVNCGAAAVGFPRFDLIAINNAGVASAVAGVAAAIPVFPAVPANSVIVAAVWRAANDNTITAADIVDKRCLLVGGGLDLANKGELHGCAAAGVDTIVPAAGADNQVLQSDAAQATGLIWRATPRLASIADTAANVRITLAAASPHVAFTGNVRLGAASSGSRHGMDSNPGANSVLNISPTRSIAVGWVGISMLPQITFTANNQTMRGLWGQASMVASAGVTGLIARGLDFQSGYTDFAGVAGSAAELTGLIAGATVLTANGASNLIVADMWGVKIAIIIAPILGTITVTNAVGILITPALSNRLANYTGLEILDETAATGNIYLMEIGPATPYLRVLGNFTAAANRTPIYVSEGAGPALRQLRTMDPGVGGANFAGGELVCILV